MKKLWRRKSLLAAALAVALLAGACCLPAYAADEAKTVTAQLSPHFTIVVDGEEQVFYNAGGDEVHPILYNGTTYLPLRAIGELMDKNVDWNQSTRTITLSGSRDGDRTKGERDKDAEKESVKASLRYDFTVVLDGEVQTFTDANGDRVYPLLYEGSTYLPLRAVGGLMGKTVDWDGKTYTATLDEGEDPLVTDADTFGKEESGYIGKAKAKTIALKDAGLKASQVTFVHVELDRDGGRVTYEVEFYRGSKEYDYEIDAVTGKILAKDNDAEYWTPDSGSQESEYIGKAKAKTIALEDAGLKYGQVTFVHVELDWDDSRWVYEVEFYRGSKEYDYEIDAFTGKILAKDNDAEYWTPDSDSQESEYIGEAKAKAIALERAGVSAGQVWEYKCELDHDDGCWVYEVEFKAGGYEFELEINAKTGAVLFCDKEWD